MDGRLSRTAPPLPQRQVHAAARRLRHDGPALLRHAAGVVRQQADGHRGPCPVRRARGALGLLGHEPRQVHPGGRALWNPVADQPARHRLRRVHRRGGYHVPERQLRLLLAGRHEPGRALRCRSRSSARPPIRGIRSMASRGAGNRGRAAIRPRPAGRCATPAQVVPGQSFDVLTALDLRVFDAVCFGSVGSPYSVPSGFALERGKCCGYTFQLYAQDKTWSDGYAGGLHHAWSLPWAVCICNDIPKKRAGRRSDERDAAFASASPRSPRGG